MFRKMICIVALSGAMLAGPALAEPGEPVFSLKHLFASESKGSLTEENKILNLACYSECKFEYLQCNQAQGSNCLPTYIACLNACFAP